MGTSTSTASAHVAAPPAVVFPRLREHDVTKFYPRWGLLPAVVEVRDQSGPWDAAARTRTLVLSDGGSVVETLTSAEPPLFAYDLSRFTGMFGRLVTGGRSEWRVAADGVGSSITWTYRFTSLPGRGLVVAAIVRWAWGPYMRRVLPRIAGWTAG